METFEQPLNFEVAADQVGGRRQPLEILGVQRTRLIGLDERYVGSVPRATIEILARACLLIRRAVHSRHYPIQRLGNDGSPATAEVEPLF